MNHPFTKQTRKSLKYLRFVSCLSFRKYCHQSQKGTGALLSLAILRGVAWQVIGNVFISKEAIKL